jgi:uncharacterized protein DUF4919
MSRHYIIVLLLLFLSSTALSSQQEQPKQSEYASLLAQIQGGDLSIDFQRLRFSYMESPERHKAKDTSDEEKTMWQALNKKDFKTAVNKADVVLANEFVNLDAHFVEFRAYEGLQDAAKSDFHKSVFSGLLKSITASGDGKSPETAYVVISTREEYVVLGVLGLQPGKQSVMHQGGHSYDLMEATNPQTKEVAKLFFNVDIPFKHYLD